MKTMTFTISGMRCDGCAQIVQNALARCDGVQTSAVSFDDGSARVLFDPARVDENRLRAAVEKAGYRLAKPVA